MRWRPCASPGSNPFGSKRKRAWYSASPSGVSSWTNSGSVSLTLTDMATPPSRAGIAKLRSQPIEQPLVCDDQGSKSGRMPVCSNPLSNRTSVAHSSNPLTPSLAMKNSRPPDAVKSWGEPLPVGLMSCTGYVPYRRPLLVQSSRSEAAAADANSRPRTLPRLETVGP